jgi:hypothetical protein
VRTGVFAALLLASVSLAWATFNWLVGPFVTSAFGTPNAGEYVVTEKSSGYPVAEVATTSYGCRTKSLNGVLKLVCGKTFGKLCRFGTVCMALATARSSGARSNK